MQQQRQNRHLIGGLITLAQSKSTVFIVEAVVVVVAVARTFCARMHQVRALRFKSLYVKFFSALFLCDCDAMRVCVCVCMHDIVVESRLTQLFAYMRTSVGMSPSPSSMLHSSADGGWHSLSAQILWLLAMAMADAQLSCLSLSKIDE